MKRRPNLVRSLKEGGYRTGIIGKLHINPASAFPFDFKKIPSGNFSRSKLGDYAKAANEFITESNAPFFLSVNYPDAHRPFINKIDGIPKQTLKGKDVKPPFVFRDRYSGIAGANSGLLQLYEPFGFID